MSHVDEYGEKLVRLLELIWGEGYMAPGGAGNVARLLDRLQPAGKRILDIGCGIGGPAREMALTHGALVTGIDLERPLIERARRDTEGAGLAERCRFAAVEAGPLPFADNAFDIVVSSGALTQTEDKAGIFREIRRVLVPCGWFSCYDWMKTDGEYSDDMRYWFEMEGLTYAMATLDEQLRLLTEAGFEKVEGVDATDWYRKTAHAEYELMRGKLYPAMVELVGRQEADHFVENWRSMVVVIDQGEMRQCYCRGRKPAD